MKFTKNISTRLLMANLLVLLSGAASFAITFRILASELFNDRLQRGFTIGPGHNSGGQGLLRVFNDSVDIALLVSLGVGVIVAGVVAWLAAKRMTVPLAEIGMTTRAIADGNFDERIGKSDVAEFDALANDVNELAQKLQITEQARARLLSDVTHELRTPLASIDGFAEGAVDGVFSTEEMHAAVTEETARLLRLVEDLSVLSKTAEHSLALNESSVEIAAVSTSAVERLRPQFAERSVEVESIIQGTAVVTGDEGRLKQVMTNLLTNALGHAHPGGVVRVTVSADDEAATVEVFDDGEGIEATDIDRVFDRFYRGPNASERPGSGLGLPVARGIAEAHGGTLSVASNGPGQGATFTLSLPLR